MIVLGVDPGFAFMGLAVVELGRTSTRVLYHQTFTTSTRDEDEARLDAIADRLLDVIEEFDAQVIGYENQAGVEVGMQRRRDEADGGGTTFSSRRVHEVSGAIRCAARCYDLPCYCLAPSTVKVALLGKGGGHAKKDRVKAAVHRFFGVVCSEHAADALAVAVATGARARRAELLLRQVKALIR